mgnify:CR=1 FL=1
MPTNFSILGVYFPPLFIAALVGLAAASATLRAMERRGLVVHFSHPSLVFFALVTIYTVIISSTVIPS